MKTKREDKRVTLVETERETKEVKTKRETKGVTLRDLTSEN